jgi:hypothetical protein
MLYPKFVSNAVSRAWKCRVQALAASALHASALWAPPLLGFFSLRLWRCALALALIGTKT